MRSPIILPQLEPTDLPTDITIRIENNYPSPLKASNKESDFYANNEEVHLFWKGVGLLIVRKGYEIIIDPDPGIEEELRRLIIIGPGLAFLLHQRGNLVLHASSVEFSGGAVVFLGDTRWGKSTLAAALHSKGKAVISDDIVAINVDKGTPMVFPGFPQLKLWPDAVSALGDDPEKLPRVYSLEDKRVRLVTRGFQASPIPLRKIYVLAEGDVNEVKPLIAQEAFVELIRHSYTTKILHNSDASSHFIQCATVVNFVEICLLRTYRDFSALPQLMRIIEDDLAEDRN